MRLGNITAAILALFLTTTFASGQVLRPGYQFTKPVTMDQGGTIGGTWAGAPIWSGEQTIQPASGTSAILNLTGTASDDRGIIRFRRNAGTSLVTDASISNAGSTFKSNISGLVAGDLGISSTSGTIAFSNDNGTTISASISPTTITLNKPVTVDLSTAGLGLDLQAGALNVDTEVARIGRADSTVRYHSIHSYHSNTGANNYLEFKLHDAVSDTSVTSVMKLGATAVTITKPTTVEGNLTLSGVGSALTNSFSVLGTEIYGIGSRFRIDTNAGTGYTGAITQDGTGLKFGHNSGSRDIQFQTNSTTRLTIGSGGGILSSSYIQAASTIVSQPATDSDAILKSAASGTGHARLQLYATGTGAASIWLDASNGDGIGSDFAAISQSDAGVLNIANYAKNAISVSTNADITFGSNISASHRHLMWGKSSTASGLAAGALGIEADTGNSSTGIGLNFGHYDSGTSGTSYTWQMSYYKGIGTAGSHRFYNYTTEVGSYSGSEWNIGADTTTANPLSIASGTQSANVTLIGKKQGTSTLSLPSSGNVSFKVSSNDNYGALIYLNNYGSGVSCVVHVGYSNSAAVISATSGGCVSGSSPGAGQVGITYTNTGSVVTIYNGDTSARTLGIVAIGAGL